jgi:hypothetical protein
MKELEKRLDNIQLRIEKILSLHNELERITSKLKAENQELAKKGEALDEQLKKAEKDIQSADYQKKTNNALKNQSINKKIDELLSEVEQCITLLKR